MPIKLTCACGKKLSVKDEMAGRRVKCPACQKAVNVPKPDVEESPIDEWDLTDTAEDNSDDAVSQPSRSARKPLVSRGSTQGKRGANAKGSKGANHGLIIGSAVGAGALAIAVLVWVLWPAKPAADSAPTGAATASSAGTPTAPQPNVPANNNAPQPEGDLALLQGSWQPTDVAVDADQPPAANMLESMKLMSWTFRGNTLAILGPQGGSASSLKVDSSQSPKILEMTKLDVGGSGKVTTAIYALEGETLKVCMMNSGTGRPQEMKPDKSTGQIVVTLKKNPSPSGATASPAPFDLEAWVEAAAKLNALQVKAHLTTRDPTSTEIPDGINHYALVDLPVMADGSISGEVWTALSSVSFLGIRTTSIADNTLRQLAQHPGLLGLAINTPSSVTAAGLAELKKCPHLRFLTFHGVTVAPDLLNEVTQLGELRVFGIDNVPVSGDMITAIVRLGKLESLSFRNAGLTDEDVSQIATLPNLKALMIPNSKITDAGLQSLKSVSGLVMLSVQGAPLSPAALADFQAALPRCKLFK